MLKMCSIGSGSKGNCILAESAATSVLIDMGLSARGVRRSLFSIGADADRISAVLLTHSHSDHIKGVAAFVKKQPVKLYGPPDAVASAIGGIDYDMYEYVTGRDFFVGDITVSPFAVSHDVPCFGYSLYSGGRKLTVVTDLGVITDDILHRIGDSDIVMLEANHDEQLLWNCGYPHYLKRRIASPRGHLSNSVCACSVTKLVMSGVKHIVLAHLSEENNSPELAYRAVCEEMNKFGLADGRDCKIHIAGQHGTGEIIEAV